jgi:hypothetical protein
VQETHEEVSPNNHIVEREKEGEREREMVDIFPHGTSQNLLIIHSNISRALLKCKL